jgi:hypothetical protein
MGESRDVAHSAGVVGEHPGGQPRQHGGAESAAAFALAQLAVEMVLGQDPFGELRQPRIEVAKGFEHQRHAFAERDGASRAGDRSVEIVAAQAFHAQPLRLEPEVALEERRLGAAHLEQRLDGLVGDVVGDVAHRDRRSVAAQADALVVPIAHAVGVELAEHRRLLAVDAVELAVHARAQRRVGREGVAHQLVAVQPPPLAVHFELELVAVGEHRVDGEHGADAVGVLEVDELLRALVEREGSRAPQVAQVMQEVVVGGDRAHQPLGVLVRELLPPQAQEEQPVLGLGERLLGAIAEGERLRRLGVGGEPERGVRADERHRLEHALASAQHLDHQRARHVGR